MLNDDQKAQKSAVCFIRFNTAKLCYGIQFLLLIMDFDNNNNN